METATTDREVECGPRATGGKYDFSRCSASDGISADEKREPPRGPEWTWLRGVRGGLSYHRILEVLPAPTSRNLKVAGAVALAATAGCAMLAALLVRNQGSVDKVAPSRTAVDEGFFRDSGSIDWSIGLEDSDWGDWGHADSKLLTDGQVGVFTQIATGYRCHRMELYTLGQLGNESSDCNGWANTNLSQCAAYCASNSWPSGCHGDSNITCAYVNWFASIGLCHLAQVCTLEAWFSDAEVWAPERTIRQDKNTDGPSGGSGEVAPLSDMGLTPSAMIAWQDHPYKCLKIVAAGVKAKPDLGLCDNTDPSFRFSVPRAGTSSTIRSIMLPHLHLDIVGVDTLEFTYHRASIAHFSMPRHDVGHIAATLDTLVDTRAPRMCLVPASDRDHGDGLRLKGCADAEASSMRIHRFRGHGLAGSSNSFGISWQSDLFTMLVKNVSYNGLAKNSVLEQNFKVAVADGVADAAGEGVQPSMVDVYVSPCDWLANSIRVKAWLGKPTKLDGTQLLGAVTKSVASMDHFGEVAVGKLVVEIDDQVNFAFRGGHTIVPLVLLLWGFVAPPHMR